MREEYQELIDEVSALLGSPATLEGRDFALIAFGAHGADGGDLPLDPVRTRSILQRRSSREVRAWFESFGIARESGPVRIPADPAAGVEHGRICLPVRHDEIAHGYIWLFDDGGPALDDPRLAAAMETAARIGALLAAEYRAGERTGALLHRLLTGSGGHEEAAEQLRDALGAAADGPLALVALTPWYADPAEPGVPSGAGIPGSLARAVLPAPSGTAEPPALAALVRLRRTGAAGPARAAAEALLRTLPASLPAGTANPPVAAGVSGPRTGLSPLRSAWREARAAARAAGAEPALGPVAEWDAIGPYRLLCSLPPGPGPDPVLEPLEGPAHRELARTAEVFLDQAGRAGRTAAALGIHRQTLYYRLNRVEQLTALDLDDGEHRLLLHMALKARKL